MVSEMTAPAFMVTMRNVVVQENDGSERPLNQANEMTSPIQLHLTVGDVALFEVR